MPHADVASRPAPPQIVEVGSHPSPEVTDRWRTLALELDGTSYFQTPDWILGWWRTIAGRPPTSLALWSNDEGRLRALVGLSRVRLRVDRRLPRVDPGDRQRGQRSWRRRSLRAHSSIRRWQATSPVGWSMPPPTRRSFSGMSTGQMKRCGCRPPESSRRRGARVCTSTTDRRRIARSANFRRQLGRFERQLCRMGIEFEWIEPACVDEALVDALFELHGRRRDTMSATSTLDARHRSLLLALLETATPTHGPAAAVARIGPRIVGVILGFRWKETFSAYQSGWDPSYAANSLGSVLLHQTIRMASRSGVQTFDFLRGDEPYKYRFGAVDTFDRSYLLARGLSGHALELELAMRRRIQAFRQSRAMRETDRQVVAPR